MQHKLTINPGDELIVTCPAVQGGPVEPTPPPPPPRNRPYIGGNTPGPNDYETGARSRMFVDLRTTARRIQANRWRVLTASDNVVWDNGVAKGAFGSLQPVIANTKPYLLSWNEGASFVGAVGARAVKADQAARTAEIYVESNMNDVDLLFNGNEEFSLLRPGYPRGTTQFITDEFKALVEPLSCLRFGPLQEMNWDFSWEPLYKTDAIAGAKKYIADRTANCTGPQVTGRAPFRIGNDVIDVELSFKQMMWKDRPKDDMNFHRREGISYEAIVRAANELNKDIWIVLQPHFSDDLALGLANLFFTKLNSNIKIKIEHGNENPWNDIVKFGQAKVIMAQADAARATDLFLTNPPENAWYIGTRYVLKRTVEASRIFKNVFGSSFSSRCEFILSGQNTNPSYTGNALNWGHRKYGNLDDLHALAFAPYVGGSKGTVDEIHATVNADIDTRYKPDSSMATWRGVADAYGKKLYGYEVGFDFIQGVENLANRIAAAYDFRIGALVVKYLKSLFDYGLDGVMWFNLCGTRQQHGPAWPLTDDASRLTQPMYAGLKTFLETYDAAPNGVTAQFFKGTTPQSGLVVTRPLKGVFHKWQAWSSGPVVYLPTLITTQVTDALVRVNFRYKGQYTLAVEKELNDEASLTELNGSYQLDYIARFSGNGASWVRLVEVLPSGEKRLAPPSVYVPV